MGPGKYLLVQIMSPIRIRYLIQKAFYLLLIERLRHTNTVGLAQITTLRIIGQNSMGFT